jgi:hypothetical protein
LRRWCHCRGGIAGGRRATSQQGYSSVQYARTHSAHSIHNANDSCSDETGIFHHPQQHVNPPYETPPDPHPTALQVHAQPAHRQPRRHGIQRCAKLFPLRHAYAGLSFFAD